MGGGVWNVNTYQHTQAANTAAGKSTFDYDDQVRAGRASGVNPLVEPKIKAGTASPHAGKVMREVMITDEHPDPTPVAVILDVTGSNYEAARVVHSKLPQLFGLLQRKGYAPDPQMLFGAIGDAHSDKFPLQVGQFESDNAMDDQLAALILEGNGGGQQHETYELAAYFLARHTYLEPFERYGKKGYAIFIGDEMPYDMVKRNYGGYYGANHTLESLTGDSIEADISTAQIFAELQERYEVFFLFQKQGSYREAEILPAWRKLLGERALVLDDPAAVCEFIAGLLGMMEGGLSVDEVTADLVAIGADSRATTVAGKALATVGGGSAIAKADGTLPNRDDEPTGGSSRL